MTAAIYTRQSLDKTGEAAGVSRQLSECEDLAARQGLTVTTKLSDNDISATTGRVRPSFEKLLTLVEAGKISTVVVWHPDRLYRKLADLVRIVDIAKAHGLNIVSVQAGEIDLSTPSGRMVASMVGSVGSYEGEHRTERQRTAYSTRAAAGEWHFSHRPYGYERTAEGVVVVEEEAALLRDLYVRYYEGGESRHALVKGLNEAGTLTATGKPWSITALREVLNNPRYAGINSYKGVVVGTGNWAPIITPEQWELYKGAASKRKVLSSSFTRSATSLLSGIIRCDVCGGKVYRKARGDGSNSHEYACSVKVCVSASAAPVDALVRAEALSALLSGPSDLIPMDTNGATFSALSEALSELQQRRDDLTEALGEGLVKLAQVRPQLEAIKTDEEGLLQRRNDLTSANVIAEVLLDIKRNLFAGPTVSIDDAAAVKAQLAERFDGLTLPRQRELVSLLLDIRLAKGRGPKRVLIEHRVVTSLN